LTYRPAVDGEVSTRYILWGLVVTMELSLRCPNCRKKQQPPFPQRCGCGQSLIAALAALRALDPDVTADREPLSGETDAPLEVVAGTLVARPLDEADGNEW
jgi:hypothetical protein